MHKNSYKSTNWKSIKIPKPINDVYVLRYALLVVLARNDDDDDFLTEWFSIPALLVTGPTVMLTRHF